MRNLGFKAISITSGYSPSHLNSTSTELNSGLNYRGFTTALYYWLISNNFQPKSNKSWAWSPSPFKALKIAINMDFYSALWADFIPFQNQIHVWGTNCTPFDSEVDCTVQSLFGHVPTRVQAWTKFVNSYKHQKWTIELVVPFLFRIWNKVLPKMTVWSRNFEQKKFCKE